ncbi:hypothetical protein G9A89_013477 [Geosiphon pyriformis]|nr:hypothetical protein G9A89_013477 [Geosiphon pyriformis]
MTVSLFSRTALDTKLITTIYTNMKIDGHTIKLILDSCRFDHATSTCIITTDGATKAPIGKIDDFSFEVNSVIIPIKVLMMKAT